MFGALKLQKDSRQNLGLQLVNCWWAAIQQQKMQSLSLLAATKDQAVKAAIHLNNVLVKEFPLRSTLFCECNMDFISPRSHCASVKFFGSFKSPSASSWKCAPAINGQSTGPGGRDSRGPSADIAEGAGGGGK